VQAHIFCKKICGHEDLRFGSVVLQTMNRCTCGPHPRIDLTAAYLEYHLNNSNRESGDDAVTTSEAFKTSKTSSSSCREEIQQACVSHGCFHISIDLSRINESYNVDDNSDDNTALPIRCLAKPIAEVENDIESLFSSSSSSVLDNHDLDGGAVKVCIKNHQCKNIEQLSASANNTSGLVEEATFRGRTAESGDEQQLIPEPKLSWEYCRCIAARLTTDTTATATAESAAATDDDDDDDTLEKSINKNNLHHYHLQNWTQALHSVASVVIHSLGIPPKVMLHEEKCDCLHNIIGLDHINKNLSPDNNSNNSDKCNVDLIRCFRYDAISATDNDNDDNEEAEQSLLGSSAHTDWGSLTVVWQDEKGGLQTYCHSCEKWSDVDATTTTSRQTSSDTDSKNNTINLFVHVGDFLSLATAGDDRIQRQHSPIWPSPRHRVICPTLQLEQSSDQRSESSSSSSNCRRSLVYFAYPPPNISLATAQAVVEPLLACENDDSCKISSDKFQDYYSLLHDQSQHQSDDSLKQENNLTEAYANMRRRPFGQVIADKWNQVQRK
jgi:hypothetical protein